jgi:hypothetical protein
VHNYVFPLGTRTSTSVPTMNVRRGQTSPCSLAKIVAACRDDTPSLV